MDWTTIIGINCAGFWALLCVFAWRNPDKSDDC